ncbi:MAG: exodeoxyribonuclease III [Flavobacteriales bacterium]|nr:exodeoxyribonuclease III [Flavobacteriales bacterium]
MDNFVTILIGMAKIVSYNVNGIRAAIKKGFLEWLEAENPDILCLQETKIQAEQVPLALFIELGYEYSYWEFAKKKGYSGVALLCKKEPNHVEYGMGNEKYDDEGRVIRVDYDDFSVISAYFPSGTTGDIRQDFKYEFLDDFKAYISKLRKQLPKLIISGDYNICHTEIDIHNPKSNKNSSGFLPEERAWVTSFLKDGFIDTFRHFNKDPHHYSWWSYRANARNNNKGWRIDYNMATSELKEHLTSASILTEAIHSDHCPVSVELDFSLS